MKISPTFSNEKNEYGELEYGASISSKKIVKIFPDISGYREPEILTNRQSSPQRSATSTSISKSH